MTNQELNLCIREAYSFIVAQTNSPQEAVQVIGGVHLTLWLNGRAEDSSVEVMLDHYRTTFIKNYRSNLDA